MVLATKYPNFFSEKSCFSVHLACQNSTDYYKNLPFTNRAILNFFFLPSSTASLLGSVLPGGAPEELYSTYFFLSRSSMTFLSLCSTNIGLQFLFSLEIIPIP